MSIDWDSNNEDILREGECPKHNCIEAAGHPGDCFPGVAKRSAMNETERPWQCALCPEEIPRDSKWITWSGPLPAHTRCTERAALEQRLEQAVMVGERAASAAEQLIADKTALEQRCRTLETALQGLLMWWGVGVTHTVDDAIAHLAARDAARAALQPQEAKP